MRAAETTKIFVFGGRSLTTAASARPSSSSMARLGHFPRSEWWTCASIRKRSSAALSRSGWLLRPAALYREPQPGVARGYLLRLAC